MTFVTIYQKQLTFSNIKLERVAHVVVVAGFLSHYLNDPLPYIPHHITINRRRNSTHFIYGYMASDIW